MSLDSHIKSLNDKVKQVEAKIHDAYVHHQPECDVLKRKKLHLLDEIAQLQSGRKNKDAA